MMLAACSGPAPAQQAVPNNVGSFVPVFTLTPAAVASALRELVGPLANERALRCTFTVVADSPWQDAGTITSATHSEQNVVVELGAIDRVAHTVQVQSPDTHGTLTLQGGDSVMFVEPMEAGSFIVLIAPFKAANGEYTASRVRSGPTAVSQFGTCAPR